MLKGDKGTVRSEGAAACGCSDGLGPPSELMEGRRSQAPPTPCGQRPQAISEQTADLEAGREPILARRLELRPTAILTLPTGSDHGLLHADRWSEASATTPIGEDRRPIQLDRHPSDTKRRRRKRPDCGKRTPVQHCRATVPNLPYLVLSTGEAPSTFVPNGWPTRDRSWLREAKQRAMAKGRSQPAPNAELALASGRMVLGAGEPHSEVEPERTRSMPREPGRELLHQREGRVDVA